MKGYFAEYLILDQLRYHALEKNPLLKSITRNLPPDFEFCRYTSVWNYRFAPQCAKSFSVDILARAKNTQDYSIVGEVKNRERKKFSKDEAVALEGKLAEIKKQENLNRVLGFIFSRNGFTKEAEAYCRKKGLAYSDDKQWFEV
ncbi:MAG: hypothetical protein GY757_06960 [bacterium]|nr:hypothetical protein [bacterium]